MTPKKKLTEKQKRFCEFYLKTGNGSEAAKLAGYKGKNYDVIASQNLVKLSIKEYLDERIKEADKKRIADADEVLEFFTSTMRGEIKDQFNLDPALSDRLKAADSLAKRYKLYDKDLNENENKVNHFTIEVIESEHKDI